MQSDKKQTLNRLVTIEGHLKGIRKMVEADHYCVDILHQVEHHGCVQRASLAANCIGGGQLLGAGPRRVLTRQLPASTSASNWHNDHVVIEMSKAPGLMKPRSLTVDVVLEELRRNHFAVLSTVGSDGAPHSAGVNYGVSSGGTPLALYVMTRRHLRKARDGTKVFTGFWIGRRILAAYERARRRGESRICFLRITPDPVVRTYMVGSSLWDLARSMEAGSGRLEIPIQHFQPQLMGLERSVLCSETTT